MGHPAIGRSSQISDGTPRTYANQFSYNPAQQLLGYTAGNSVQGIFGYSDPRLQIGSLSYKKGVNTLFSLSYGYAQPNGANNGQITAITDNITAANGLTFTYDAMGRLINGKTANTTSPNTWDITWGYDRYANRKSQTENAGTLPVTNANLTFNNNNQITGGFAYDASGNMTNDGITTNYVYNAENRFVKLGSTLANTYDGAGLRIEKVTGGSTTVYIFSGTKVIAEYTPSAATTAPTKEYIYSGTQLLATLDASHNPTYRQSDHLSARLFTDASGNSVGTQGHLPFGEGWYSTGTADKWKFTTYERDSDTNLDYAMMRFDSARLARFMSPDPYPGSADAGSPQSWNRYAYVINNPVGFVDPYGFFYGPPPAPDPDPEPPSFEAIMPWSNMSARFWHLTVAEWDDMHPNLALFKRKVICPPVPTHPDNANLDENIASAAQHPVSTWNPISNVSNGFWFKNQVKNRAPWDYKQIDKVNGQPSPYEDFGNFNYGATAAAAGFSPVTTLRLAGWGAERAGTSYPDQGSSGVLTLPGQVPLPLPGGGWGAFGDDPKDQLQIMLGYLYQISGCHA